MSLPARWIVSPQRPDEAASLAAELNIGMPAARVLVSRGFTSAAAARRFLQPSLTDLHDPLLLLGVREAVERIRTAVANQEPILIYGDYDVDGTTSVIVLKKAIE